MKSYNVAVVCAAAAAAVASASAPPKVTFEAPVSMGTQDYYTTGFMGFPDGRHALGKTEGGWVATSGELCATIAVPEGSWWGTREGGTDAETTRHTATQTEPSPGTRSTW